MDFRAKSCVGYPCPFNNHSMDLLLTSTFKKLIVWDSDRIPVNVTVLLNQYLDKCTETWNAQTLHALIGKINEANMALS